MDSGRFNETELLAMHDELGHFERKLDKIDFFSEELGKQKKSDRKAGKIDGEHAAESFAGKKLADLHQKSEKLEKYLSTKIGHTEL